MRTHIRFPLVPFPFDFANAPANLEVPFLIQDFLPRGYLAILASTPKEGKSCLATALALAVASGTPFAGMPTTQSPVLWLSLEESPAERNLLLSHAPKQVKERIAPSSFLRSENEEGVGGGGTTNSEICHLKSEILSQPPGAQGQSRSCLYHAYATNPIDTPFGMAELEAAIAETNAGLVVIDPLHAATSGLSLYDPSNARRALQELKVLCTRTQVTALILHDIRERGQARPAESQQLSAIASMYLLLRWRQDCAMESLGPRYETDSSEESESSNQPLGPLPRLYELTYRGRGAFANGAMWLQSSAPLDYVPVKPPIVKAARADDSRKPVEDAIIAALLKGPRTVSELLPEVFAAPSSVKNAVTRLYQSEVITVHSVESGVRKYRIRRSD